MRVLTPLSWILTGAAVGFGLWRALDAAWVCDDAFISFRYARNLVDGLGLVYNAGERVEGYTNFLWVIWLALGMAFDVDPVAGSQFLGAVFFAATIGLLGVVAVRHRMLPIAAVGLALHGHSAWFSTCGLETSMFTFLVTAGLVLLVSASRPRRFTGAGLALILATMTRPDGAIFYACGGGLVLWLALRHRMWSGLASYALPFVVIYLPYFAWKYSYYGYPVPNTFYAKSASEPYFGQGLYYVGLFLACYYILIPALVVPSILFWRRRQTLIDAGLDGRRGPLGIALFTLPFLAYVVWVGGDFMFSRFCLPVTPALLLGLQLSLRDVRRGTAVGVFVVLGSIFPWYPGDRIARGNPNHVVEERDHYPEWYVETYRILGETLRRRCAGVDLRVAIGGAQAMLAWFGRFAYVLELHGLTDATIAHRPITNRGHVGHEKALRLDDRYLREKRIHMVVGAYEQRKIPGDRIAELRRFEFSVVDVPFFGRPTTARAQATLLIYDGAVMRQLADRKGLYFEPFPRFLDEYIAGLAGRTKAEVRADLAAFRDFYFEHNVDPERLAKIEAFLRESP